MHPARPKRLEFRAEGRLLVGVDPDGGAVYRIRYVGNGEHSHYWLVPDGDPENYFYAFPGSDLYPSIREAEYRLVFGVAKPDPSA